MKTDQPFRGKSDEILKVGFGWLRRRNPAATWSHKRRKHGRKQTRIPPSNRQGWERPFVPWMTCAMAGMVRPSQGRLAAF